MFKNVAAKFIVFAFDSTTNLQKTGDAANITAYVSKDYGTVTVLGDTSATEMDATNAKGYYLFDAAQAETNADCLMVSAKSSTSNIVVVGAPAVIYTRPTTGWLAPTVAARTLDVSAGGEAGVDWSNVGSPTTSLALTGTTIAVTQKVDVDTIKTNPVVNGGTTTFPTNKTLASTDNITAATGVDITKILGTAISTPATAGILDVNIKNIDNDAASASGTVTFPNATLASTANITAGTITTVTNLTNAPTAGDLTAAMKASVTTACTASTPTAAAVTAAVAITSNIKKNQALAKFEFLMTDSTNHNPSTGLTVTCTRSIDGAAFGAGTLANVAEVANGLYSVDFGAGDLNGNVIALRATAAASDDTFERIVTQP